MAPEKITATLYRIPFAVGQAYLWADDDGLTLIDAGVLGSGPVIAAAVTALGRRTDELRQIVLTHFHEDHAGAAAEVAAWHGAPVLAHHLEAPIRLRPWPSHPPRRFGRDACQPRRLIGGRHATGHGVWR
jgi:glyoxylase-like metal-dependent hydrolase (beta-lactamase superfamily II)